MFYRLSYTHNDITDTKELCTSKDLAEIYAEDLLEQHNNIGTVIIERRPSEYWGDFSHVLTISRGTEDIKDIIARKNLEVTFAVPNIRRNIKELCIFKQLKLDEEPQEFRKLSWICECKKYTMIGSETRKYLIDLRDKQLVKVKELGFDMDKILEMAEFYEFEDELIRS